MVSIIIPVYNVEKALLYNCIDSVLNSTYKNIELLLIDDGSSDGSGSICDEYLYKDSRCKVIHKSNEGISETRNKGLRMAKGNFIFFLDSDDFIHPQMIEILRNALHSNPKIDISMCFGYQIYNSNPINNTIYNISCINALQVNQEVLMKNLFGQSSSDEWQYMAVWNKMYKKELLESVWFEESGAEDLLFNCKVYNKSQHILLIPEKLHYWVQRNNSTSHKQINKKYIDRIDVYAECIEHLVQNNNTEACNYAISKLLRYNLTMRYRTQNTEFKEYTSQKAKTVWKNYSLQYLKSNNNTISEKILLFVFYKLPLMHNLFMSFMEKLAQLRAKKNDLLGTR